MTIPALDDLRRLRLLRDVDVHLASALARIAGDDDPLVALGVAVASRAPGAGHLCAELRALDRLVRMEEPEAEPVSWPDAHAWCERLRRSPAVRVEGGDGAADELPPRPLVLHGDRLYLQRYWCHQQRLLASLTMRASREMDGVDEALLAGGLTRYFPEAATTGDDRQRVAACVAVLRGLTVITGGPGTGKTTTVVKILALLLEQALARGARAPRIALAAPTGKAAARMAEAVQHGARQLGAADDVHALLPAHATTLHRLLGVDPDRPSRVRHHARNPVAADVVVVDEASMVDLAMFARLVDAVPPDARLILLGDRDQLASVEAGAILGDVCGSGDMGFSSPFAERVRRLARASYSVPPGDGAGMWECVVRLTRSHRFREDSGIGALAKCVNDGDDERAAQLLASAASDDALGWIPVAEDARDADCLRDLALEEYSSYLAAGDPLAALDALDRFRFLCAHREGAFGVHALNERVAQWLRERRLLGAESANPRGWWHGRPIIVTENDHVLELYNGDTGVILADGDRPRAWFRGTGGALRAISTTRLPAHETVFAMTVHKAQGSEFDRVAVVLPQRRSPVLTRELLYTGVTRARQRVTIVGSAEVLREGVKDRVQRASGIREALWSSGTRVAVPAGGDC